MPSSDGLQRAWLNALSRTTFLPKMLSIKSQQNDGASQMILKGSLASWQAMPVIISVGLTYLLMGEYTARNPRARSFLESRRRPINTRHICYPMSAVDFVKGL